MVVRAEALPDEEEVLAPPPAEESAEAPEPAPAEAAASGAEERARPAKRGRRLWWRKRAQRPRGSGGEAPSGEEG